MKETRNVTPEVWAIINKIEEAVITAQKLKAVSIAFSEEFVSNGTDRNLAAIMERPEYYSSLYIAMEGFIDSLNDTIKAADNASRAYCQKARAEDDNIKGIEAIDIDIPPELEDKIAALRSDKYFSDMSDAEIVRHLLKLGLEAQE